MLFIPLASGSKGNLYYYQSQNVALLIDFGISIRKAFQLFDEAKIDTSKIEGLFVTHAHADHVRSVPAFARRFNIPVFGAKKTIGFLQKKCDRADQLFIINGTFQFHHLTIDSFNTYHDSAGSCAYSIFDGSERLTILTDTGKYDEKMINFAEQSQVLVLESNYDLMMLQNGPYPPYIKSRIRSDFGHLSNEKAAEFLEKCEFIHLKSLYIGHVSENNNTPELAMQHLSRVMQNKELIDVPIRLAYQHRSSEPYESEKIMAVSNE